MDAFMSQQELVEKYGYDLAVILDRAKHELEYICTNGENSVPVESTIEKPKNVPYGVNILPRKKALRNLIEFSCKDKNDKSFLFPNFYELKTKVIKNFLRIHYPILGDAYNIDS